MKGIIRLGDKTDHGGEVITASSTFVCLGKGVARVGDLVTCPKDGHGVTAIIEGHATFTDNGIPVAFDGHQAACGCKLISSLTSVNSE